LWCHFAAAIAHSAANHQQHENRHHCGRRADHLDAAHVDPPNHGDDEHAHHVVLPSHNRREVETQVIGSQYGIRGRQQKRGAPVPPSRLKSPEVAEGRAHPAVESALDGNRSGQLRRDQRNGNAPEKRNEQVIQQR